MTLTQCFFLGLAAFAANLPFITQRFFLVWPAKGDVKRLHWCLVELMTAYLFLLSVGIGLEAQQGPVHQQSWVFYATTFSLMLVAAFPGFVYRFFWRKA